MAQRYLFTNFWLILYCLLLMAVFAVPFCGFASVNLHERQLSAIGTFAVSYYFVLI